MNCLSKQCNFVIWIIVSYERTKYKFPMILPESFYTRKDVVKIARELLGKVLVTDFHSKRTAGIIVETEAYAGETDMASHAFGGRRTKRTETMYMHGGTAYV